MHYERRWGLRRIPRAAFLLGVAASVLLVAAPLARAGTALVAGGAFTQDVRVLDTKANRVVGNPIKVGTGPSAIAITPDGKRAYVANSESKSVSVINLTTDEVLPVHDGSAINVGVVPRAVAITPDGRFAYVTNAVDRNVSVIDTARNEVTGQPIPVGILPSGVAISPDGKRAYVVNSGIGSNGGSVSVIDTATKQVIGSSIPLGTAPSAIAITPDGKTAYVVNSGTASGLERGISVINLATGEPLPQELPVGREPRSIAISPDGKTAWVASASGNTVEPFDVASNEAEEDVRLGGQPVALAIDPSGSNLYAVEEGPPGAVAVINPKTSTLRTVPDGNAIAVGGQPRAIAIAPGQSPLAALTFSSRSVPPGTPVSLDASASTDPDGAIASYAWSFGDGATTAGPAAKVSHTYTAPGTYRVTLRISDDEGCGAAEIFTGQTAYCSGGGTAQASGTITVANPNSNRNSGVRVRVRCPKKAGRRCTIKVQAIAKRPSKRRKRVKPESSVAIAKAKAGKTAIVSLKPLPAFAEALGGATKVRVKETIVGKKFRRTSYPLLKVLH